MGHSGGSNLPPEQMTAHSGRVVGLSSNAAYARGLAESIVRRDDTTLIEALLADAIGHLCDAIDELTSRGQSE